MDSHRSASNADPSPQVSSDHEMKRMEMPQGHGMAANDPTNPMNWPLLKKTYASAVSFAFTFTLLFAAGSFAASVNGVSMEFGVNMQHATLGFSLFIFGIFFAPLWSPHLVEMFGRTPIYFVSTIIMSLFLIGAGFSKSFTSLAVCRFFAGFFGGSNVVNIEGTFADLWSASHTLTYYASLTLASYLGAAFGPVICGIIVKAENWRYSQYVSLMMALATLLLATGVPETYPREIIRKRARRNNMPHNLPPAQSGVTIPQMATLTIVYPLRMMVTEPLVLACALFMGLNFGVLFSWFIAVPAVLNLTYNFNIAQAGYAFISAVGGTILAVISTILIEQVMRPFVMRRMKDMGAMNVMPIEYRLIPAIIGQVFLAVSLFWIGWTAKPTVHFTVPIVGTAFYVWGSAMGLIGIISYIFDAYSPQGILSALTAIACTRIFCAGIVPLFIIQAIMNLTGPWALSLFGFIAIGFIPIPVGLFFFGQKLRAHSKFAPGRGGPSEMSPMQNELMLCEDVLSNARQQGVPIGDDVRCAPHSMQ